MLFYITMFVVCVIAALGFLFLYRSLGSIGKIVFSAFLPTAAQKKSPGPPKVRTLAPSVNDTLTPWGWDSKTTKGRATRTRPTASQGRKPRGRASSYNGTAMHGGGSAMNGHSVNRQDHVSKPVKIVNPDVGWPYREEKFEIDAKNDKAVRKTPPKPKPTDLSKTSKPWGW